MYIDSAFLREVFPLTYDAFALRAESNGTRMLVRQIGLPFTHAINEAYGDCLVYENPEYRVYEAWRCPGGETALESGVRSRRPIEIAG